MPGNRWLDFSGAPPLLIPLSLLPFWRGIIDPSTGDYRDYDEDNPVTDYDRACRAAWPGRSALDVGGKQVLALYTESDRHSWDSHHRVVGCGGRWPTRDELRKASWTDPIRWHTDERSHLLMNSAADGREKLRFDDFLPVQLSPGSYTVTTACIKYNYFHRFVGTTA